MADLLLSRRSFLMASAVGTSSLVLAGCDQFDFLGQRDHHIRNVLERANSLTYQAQRLLAGESWDAVLKTVGGSTAPVKGAPAADAVQFTPVKSIARAEKETPRDIVTGAFVLTPPAPGRVSVGQKTLPSGDVVVYTVSAVKPGEYKADDVQANRKLAQNYSAEEIEAYVAGMRAKAKISIGSTLFD